MSGDLSSYTELADLLDSLPLIVREARRARQVTLRIVAEQAGLSESTLSRIERSGEDSELGPRTISLEGAIALLRWLGRTEGQ